MKRRILAMALATALALSLTACGGGNNSNSSASNPGGSSSSSSSQPDASNPDASNPDGSGDTSFTPEPLPNNVTLTLNKTEVTLNKAGATFQLRYSAEPEVNNLPVYGSDNAQVATISADGTITAVAPGKATITVELAGASAACTVTCDWQIETKPTEPSKPAEPSKPTEPEKPAEPDPAPAANVDLADFYTTITGKYDFTFMMEADADMLAQYQSNMAETAPKAYYAGLENVKLKQRVIYMCGMSPAPTGDFALVEVENAKDVATVKAIFQAQIDYMVGDGENRGGAFYPMEQTTWEENARIAANGNYVMLIAHDNCDDIVNEFNALFK